MTSLSTALLVALGSGIAGWALENAVHQALSPPNEPLRYSALLPGLPFMPVYAAGGALVYLMKPHVRDFHPAARALVYGGALTLLEGAAGSLDRANGQRSWDYGDGRVVDLPHAAIWALAGLGLEHVLTRSGV